MNQIDQIATEPVSAVRDFWGTVLRLVIYAPALVTGVADVLLPPAPSTICTSATWPWYHCKIGASPRVVVLILQRRPCWASGLNTCAISACH